MATPRSYGRWRGFTDIVAALLGNPGGAHKLDAAFGALSAAAGAFTALTTDGGAPVPEMMEIATVYDLAVTNAPATIVPARAGKAFLITNLLQECTAAGGSISTGGSITFKDSAGNMIRTATAVAASTNVVGRVVVLASNGIQIATSGVITIETVAATGSGLVAAARFKLLGTWVAA